MANKIIISCAITGSIHTPTMSDALPITPDQIATQAVDAAKAGAAILHLHARDPKDRALRPIPTSSCSSCRGSSKVRCRDQHHHRRCRYHDGGSTHFRRRKTVAGNVLAQHGLDEFRLYPMARRYKNWKYDWEESYLTNSGGYISRILRDIEKIYKTLGEGHGVKFEHECYHRATSTIPPIASPRLVQAAGIRAADFRHSRRYRCRSR